jgi:hypothetical protein
MEPKASAQVASGPGFSITINLQDTQKKQVVDAEPVEQVEFEPPKLNLKVKPAFEDNE